MIFQKDFKERILVILEKLHLTDKKINWCPLLSGGMKRRMNIAMATIHNPSVVVFGRTIRRFGSTV